MTPDPIQAKRILIRSANWIGDAVMSTPAVHTIRRNFPEAHIGILAKPWVAPVFHANPHADEVLIYDAKGAHKGLLGRWRLAGRLRRQNWEMGVVLPNSFESALLFAMARIPFRIGYKTQYRRLLLSHPIVLNRQLKENSHETGHYLRLLELSGLRVEPSGLELYVVPDDKIRGADLLRKNGIITGELLIGINPGAAFGTAKRWPADRYARLADRLAKQYQGRILIFGGPGERGVAQEVADAMNHTPIILSGKTTLGEAIALVDQCPLLVTNDSGLMHIGAALHQPMVAIFGPTNPLTTGPLSAKAKIIQDPIECSPCLQRECPLGHHGCMENISVERVLGMCQWQLAQSA